MSEPQNSGALAVEMAGLDVIPESDRKGKPSDLFMPWFAANISVLGISWGSWVLGFGLSLTQAVIVSVVGVALSFLVCGLIAIAGKRGSAPTLVLSRAAFGFNGNRISAAISWNPDGGLGDLPCDHGRPGHGHRHGGRSASRTTSSPRSSR